jgi:hypothetical protein
MSDVRRGMNDLRRTMNDPLGARTDPCSEDNDASGQRVVPSFSMNDVAFHVVDHV